MADTTEYRCDGCGKTSTHADVWTPVGWYRISGGPKRLELEAGFHGWHACSPQCVATIGRKHEMSELLETVNLAYDDISDHLTDVMNEKVAAALPRPASPATPAKKATAKKPAARPRKAA